MAASAIPIKNVYYLFLYAWGRFPEGRQVEVGTDDSPDLANLLARVLANGVQRLVRRGIDRGYQAHTEELKGPRGRFLLTPSITSGALQRHRLVCSYDELTADILHNRILKATLRRLAAHDEIDASLAGELHALARRLVEVQDVPLSRALFRRVQLNRSIGHYDLLLRICEMAFEVLQPETGGATSKFAAVLEDQERMSTIFERFVRNFLALEQNIYSVDATQVKWDTGELDSRHASYLPRMQTDVILRSNTQTIIIDAKFYKETFRKNRDGLPKVHSAHLYQMLTYLDHTRRTDRQCQSVRGILLYPSTDGCEVSLSYNLGGSRLDVETTDLARPWKHVHDRVLGLVTAKNTA